MTRSLDGPPEIAPTMPPPKPMPIPTTSATTSAGASHEGRPRPPLGGVRGVYWGSRTVTGRSLPESPGSGAGTKNAPSGRADGA